MFAQLITVVWGGNEPDPSVEIAESVLPTLKSLPGLKGLVILTDATTRAVVTMMLWESAEAMERSEPVLSGLRRAETSMRDVVSQESKSFRVVAFHLTHLLP